MKKIAWKRLLACVLVAVLLLPAGVHASATDIEVAVTVPHTQTDSNRTNYFVFASNQWTEGNEAHTWSNTPNATNPRATYYEVHFTGHKIDVYAGKNNPMGKVEYFIDDASQGVYNLYNNGNINETLIATYDNLSEGPHIFRAEATGQKDDAATNTLIDCAKVVVYSYRSASEPLYGAIVDDDLQYVQADIDSAFAVDAQSQTLNAWRNDTAVSQIFLAAGGSDLHNLTATAGSFSDGNGHTIPAGQVTLSFIQTVQAYTGMPGYASTPARPVPEGSREEAAEVLMGNTVDTLESGNVKGLWVSIDVPKDAEPGEYQGAVTVTANELTEAQKLTFRYTLTVAESTLPDAAEFKDSFDIELWQNPYASAEYYDVEPFSAKHFEILTPIMEKYKSIGGHAITTTIVDEAWSGQTYSKNEVRFPGMVKWTKTSAGAWSFDYTQLDAWITFNKETIGIGDKIVCYSVAPWTNAIPYYDEASGTTMSISKANYPAWTDEWAAAWTAFLTDLMAHMEAKGWKDETYIGIDERGIFTEPFDLIDSVTGTDGKPFKTAGALDNFVGKKALAMRVDDMNVGSTAVKDHPADFATLVADREAQGLRTTVYSCTGHAPGNFSLSAPGESYWTMMYSYSVGGAGFMRWSYDSWVEDPLRDTTHCNFEAGDCFSIFPDEKTAEHPVAHSSLRLEKMAQGVRDVNKLITIKENCPAMERAVDALMASVKPTYATSGYYLTAAAKETLAADMKTLREGIVSLTEEYEERLETGDTKKLEIQYTIPQIVLPEKYKGDVEGPDVKGGTRQYLGQPDMIMLEDGNTLVTAFPIGHGCGALVLKKSEDRGETWEEITDTPTSWTRSLETPTMYRLNMTDGSTKYVLIAGRPYWSYNVGDSATGGWDVSISDDGIHWSEYTQYHGDSGIFTTVAMASLVQLKENGAYIDKWMGVFHDGGSFVNYKTYLTFDEEGNMQWSAPEPYLTKYRAIEQARSICEVGMFRSPDGNRIMAMGRAQSHAHKSVMFWSDDEGETWSKPVDMQGALQGERHKALYDPITGRLLITFREIILDVNQNGQIEGGDWLAGDWIAWVGTYQDLMERNEGEYRILLDEDWANSPKSGDTGYTGMAVYPDGTFVLDTYGHWDKEFSQTMGYDVRQDRCWIRRAKFKLAEIDELYQAALDARLDEIPSDVLARNADANSKQLPAPNATDGGPAWAFDTQEHWWHSRYSGTADEGDTTNGKPSATNPIWIQTGFDEARYIKELSYEPRTHGNNTCNINAYEVQLACLDDPTATPTDADFVTVQRGNLNDVSTPQTITLDKAYLATHIRLVAAGRVYGNNEYVTAKRIRIYAARAGELLPPDELTITGEGVEGSEATLITNVDEARTIQLSVTTTPEERNPSVTWESTNEHVATVDENGVVTAVANGTTAIKATSAAITEDSGVKPAEANYTIHVVTRIENITVMKDGAAIGDTPVKVYVKVKETDTAHPNSVTLTTETDPVEVPHPERNWVQVDGKEGMISIVASGTNSATATIAANGTELDVGEVTVRVESAEHPEVYTDFTVQVIRYLDHDIYITGDAKVGSTLTASTVNLVMTDEAKAHLSYQWYCDSVSEGNKIEGATEKQYKVTAADIDHKLVVTATAAPDTFYEGTREAQTEAPVAKADGPAAPTGLTAVNCTDGNDGQITGLDATKVYEYKLADADKWTEVDENSTYIGDLPAGNYQVRIAETDTQEAGKAAIVTVMAADVTAYTITADEVEGGVIEISASQAAAEAEITVTLTPDTGYELVKDSLEVTYIDSEGEEQTVTVNDGVFEMPAGNVTITAEFAKKTFTITHAMENVTCSLPGEDVHTVEYGDKPNIKLTAKDGYTMPGNMQVTYVDEEGNTQPFYGYEYSRSAADPDTATLKFTDGITANLTVTATIPEKTFTVDYTLKNGLKAPTDNAPRTVGYKAAYTGKLVAEDPTKYTLPLGITATMDGESFADFTYDSETGVITIAADKITGDLVITASGVDARVPVKPVTGVEVQKTLTVQAGKSEALTATIKPADATLKDVVWESADHAIATVDEDGVVIGVAEGETEITVTTVDGHRTAICKVTVTKAATSNPAVPVISTGTTDDGFPTTTETRPDGTKVDTTEKPDGTKEIVETKPDGTVTETTEKPDGTKESTETKPDGTVTESVEKSDGSKEAVETKPDGTVTETKIDAEGAKVEKVTDPEENVTITATDAEGETVAEVKVPAVIPEAEKRFEDVPVGHWADEAIHKLAAIEVVNGVTDTQYSPVVPMKRGDLATVLFRLSNGKEGLTDTFADVESGKYYADGIAWAAKVGVVEGYSDEEFRPEAVITREQLALMLMRYAKLLGVDTSADAEALNAFADGGKTSSWAVDGVAWCVKAGIIQGMDDVTLSPNTNVSRAQVAVMVDRFLKLMK